MTDQEYRDEISQLKTSIKMMHNILSYKLNTLQALHSILRSDIKTGSPNVNQCLLYMEYYNQSLQALLPYMGTKMEAHDSNELILVKKEVIPDFKLWLDEKLRVFSEMCTYKNVRFHPRIKNPLPQEIRTDKFKLGQILSQLLENAIEFSPANSSITVEVFEKNNFLNIEITDQGQKIPLNAMEDLFKPTLRLGATRAESGYVFYIIKMFLESLKGDIHVSETRDGMWFTLLIPYL